MSIRGGGIVNSNACGLGNKLFQFVTMLTYADLHNLHLRGGVPKKFLKYIYFDSQKIAHISNLNTNLPVKNIGSGHYDNEDNLKYDGHYNYETKDFLQHSKFLNDNYNRIIKYVIMEEQKKFIPSIDFTVNDNDIICFVRLGEIMYKGENNPSSEGIHPNYYLNVLKMKNFNKVYFRIHPFDDKRINKYMSYFDQYKDKIVMLSAPNDTFDFHIVKHFKNIAISNSTFNWWSIYILDDLENKTVYTPKYFGHKGYKKEKHGIHVKDLWNIRNCTIPIEHDFISMD
uniref:Glycosyl transferase family 11 n=1 Tax=viral metagenome TaxID=1070528 RepID=A0A6C0BUB0_9ZZZZ